MSHSVSILGVSKFKRNGDAEIHVPLLKIEIDLYNGFAFQFTFLIASCIGEIVTNSIVIKTMKISSRRTLTKSRRKL